MKKSLFLSLVISLFGLGMIALSASAVEVTTTANLDGELIKGESYQTVYYLAEDGKRYVFPNSKTYFSWFDDFSEVTEIPDEELFSYPLGGNVRYKPGSLLVKITTDPRVYAVGENGTLRWVKSENVAKALYGANWNKLVDDLPDSFFTNYEVGAEIDSDEDYDPTEAEQEIPSISHNRGFKAKVAIQNRIQDVKERQCNRLEEAVNKLQRRAAMYGLEIEGAGDDFISECIENNQVRKREKITICHTNRDGVQKTLNVAPTALRGMLAERATLGECENATEEDDSSDEGEDSECLVDSDDYSSCIAIEEAQAEVASTTEALDLAKELASSTALALEEAQAEAASTTEALDLAKELASSTALALEEAQASASSTQSEIDDAQTAADDAESALELAQTAADDAESALELA
ncbi:hypothetical protein C0584_01925, partial [Candidatus Parcubacteria bacterium]